MMEMVPLLALEGLVWVDGLLHALLGWKLASPPFLEPALPTAQGEGTIRLVGPKPKSGLPL